MVHLILTCARFWATKTSIQCKSKKKKATNWNSFYSFLLSKCLHWFNVFVLRMCWLHSGRAHMPRMHIKNLLILHIDIHRLAIFGMKMHWWLIGNIVCEPLSMKKRKNQILIFWCAMNRKTSLKRVSPFYLMVSAICSSIFELFHLIKYPFRSVRNAVVSAIYCGHIFGVHLFAWAAKFAWQMFAVLLVWLGHWLHSDGIGAAQRMELCGANAMQISWLCYLFLIFICVSLVERYKLRSVVEFPVKRIKSNISTIWS